MATLALPQFLWAHSTRMDRGQEVVPERSVDALRHQALSLLQGNHTLGHLSRPPSWPSLDALPNGEVSLSQLWSRVPEQVDTLVLVVESPESPVGQEVTLDLSGNPRCRVWRLVNESSSSTLLRELPNAEPLPGGLATQAIIYIIRRRSNPKLLLRVPNGDSSRQLVRDALLPFRANEEGSEPGLEEGDSGNRSLAVPSRVYLADLNNALVYTLSQEVALHETLNQSQMRVLENFVNILNQFFPGDPPTMRFLARLQGYLTSFSERNHVLRGEDLSSFLVSGGSEDSRLPEMGAYVGCLGSRPGLRGYPCSLWMLFHSLTVNAYHASSASEYASGESHSLRGEIPTSPRMVLLTIRDYVSHFFTCRECAGHFASMAAGMETKVQKPRDAVLWLWRAHNTVNQRLSGDRTEDPAAPKVPFPPASLCAQCRLSRRRSDSIDWNVFWNIDRTLQFLLRFYSGDSVAAAAPTVPAGTWRGPSITLPLALTAVLLVLLLVALLGPLGRGRRRLRPCRRLCARRASPA
ncbi:unnamed protein product [Ixodes hexagonus]